MTLTYMFQSRSELFSLMLFTLKWGTVLLLFCGQSIADPAPRILTVIPVRRCKKRTMREALNNHTWISDIQGGLPVGVLIDYP
jgi:hypothetical protein